MRSLLQFIEAARGAHEAGQVHDIAPAEKGYADA